MSISQGCRLFLMLAFFAGLYSVNGNTPKRGCLGDTIKIFENISLNTPTEVSIYKNGDSNTIMGLWQIKNSVPPKINGQNDRVFLDKNGNIWIVNLLRSDETKFTIQIDIENTSMKHEVTLDVMVPPTKKCRPRIVPNDRSLSAFLPNDECGKPVATVYWLEHSGTTIAKEVIRLQSGKSNGIYHACIEGDALLCANTSHFSDYCSVYNDSESEPLTDQCVAAGSNPSKSLDNSPCESPNPSAVTTSICVMVAICLLLLILLFLERIFTYCSTREGNQTNLIKPKKKTVETTPLQPT